MLMWYMTGWVVIAIITAMVADKKNRSGSNWVLLSIPFGIFALLVLALLEPLPAPEPAAAVALANDTKKCPACAEFIKAEAIKCRYCGTELKHLT